MPSRKASSEILQTATIRIPFKATNPLTIWLEMAATPESP